MHRGVHCHPTPEASRSSPLQLQLLNTHFALVGLPGGASTSASRRISPRQNGHRLHRVACAASAAVAPPAASAPPAGGKRLAVFVSGGGSNFKAIHQAILRGEIGAEVAVVVTNVPGCGGVAYATAHAIPVLTYPPPKADPTAGLTEDQLVAALKQDHAVDIVLLAGYLKLIPLPLVRAYHRAMLNIHPALLPSFGGHGLYGRRVHEAVIASGARFSGPTVHFVAEEYDTGPILGQAVVEVGGLDTAGALAARVLAQEHSLYPRCVAALAEGRVTWREDGVPIMWNAL